MVCNTLENCWERQNIILPHGCPLQFIHWGVPVAYGNVKNGKLCADGILGFESPSAAIGSVVAKKVGRYKRGLNGWMYIEVPLLGGGWVSLHELRASVESRWAYCVPKINFSPSMYKFHPPMKPLEAIQ